MTTRARAIHLKHQQQPLLCKSQIEAPTGALGIRLFIRLFKIRLNSPVHLWSDNVWLSGSYSIMMIILVSVSTLLIKCIFLASTSLAKCKCIFCAKQSRNRFCATSPPENFIPPPIPQNMFSVKISFYDQTWLCPLVCLYGLWWQDLVKSQLQKSMVPKLWRKLVGWRI